MNTPASDELRAPTIEDINKQLKIASKRGPRMLIMVSMMIDLFEGMDPSDADLDRALMFFEFSCSNPRVAMFLASAGEFMRGDDDRPTTPETPESDDWGNEPTLTGEPLPTLAS